MTERSMLMQRWARRGHSLCRAAMTATVTVAVLAAGMIGVLAAALLLTTLVVAVGVDGPAAVPVGIGLLIWLVIVVVKVSEEWR